MARAGVRRGLLWAAALAATLAAAAWIWSRYSGGWRRFVELAGEIPASLWPWILAATAAFYALDWLRFYCLLRLFDVRLSPASGLRLTFVSDFVTSLTPVTELNLPSMVYFLGRDGIPPSTATAVTLVKSITMTLWVCASAGLALHFDGDARLPPRVAEFLPVSLACVAALSLTLASIAFFPERVLAWTRSSLEAGGGPLRRRVLEGLGHTASSIAAIGGARGRWQWLTHAAALASVAAYAAVGVLLARGLGLELSAGRAAAAFSTSLMVAYLAPVPGSIGITEWVTSYLLDPAMTQPGMAAAILLRTLTCYAGIPIGAFYVGLEAWRRGARLTA